jgi:hypothetical protein
LIIWLAGSFWQEGEKGHVDGRFYVDVETELEVVFAREITECERPHVNDIARAHKAK